MADSLLRGAGLTALSQVLGSRRIGEYRPPCLVKQPQRLHRFLCSRSSPQGAGRHRLKHLAADQNLFCSIFILQPHWLQAQSNFIRTRTEEQDNHGHLRRKVSIATNDMQADSRKDWCRNMTDWQPFCLDDPFFVQVSNLRSIP